MVKFCPVCGSILRQTKNVGNEYQICECGFKTTVSKNKSYLQGFGKEERPMFENPSYMVDYYKDRIEKSKEREDTYTCPKCGQKAMMARQKQMRSAHKGMTYFLVCSKCGKMVRKNNF